MTRYKLACALPQSPLVLKDILRYFDRFFAVSVPLPDLYCGNFTKKEKGNKMSLATCSWQIHGDPSDVRLHSSQGKFYPVTLCYDTAGQMSMLSRSACFSLKDERQKCWIPWSSTACGSTSATISNMWTASKFAITGWILLSLVSLNINKGS